MRNWLTHRKLLAAAATLLLAAFPAAASAATDPSACSAPRLSQPFLSIKDANWYTLVAGQNVGAFDGTGWTLTGGARVVTTTLADGSTTTVLDLPSGSLAVSPEVCVKKDYPTARSMVRNVKGSEGISFYVSHYGTRSWDTPKNTGQFHGSGTSWTASKSLNVQPSDTPSWNIARFTFIAGGRTSRFQMYDFYVDPRMR